MEKVVIFDNNIPTCPLKLCDYKIYCYFHEANVSETSFGNAVVMVHEDFSHSWGVMWDPLLNKKFIQSFNDLFDEFVEDKGYKPDIADLSQFICRVGLKDFVMSPRSREIFQRGIEIGEGFMAKRNRGFVHYVILDNLLQDFQDILYS